MGQTSSYSDRFAPSAPVVAVSLAGTTLECLVDTGFSGGLMVPFPTFESLGLLSALVPDEYQAVMPDSTKVPVYTAEGQVAVGAIQFATRIHASPRIEKTLVGRAFLASFVSVLDGPQGRLSLS